MCVQNVTECFSRNLHKERITELWLISPAIPRIYLELHNCWYCFFKRYVKLLRPRAILYGSLSFGLLAVTNSEMCMSYMKLGAY